MRTIESAQRAARVADGDADRSADGDAVALDRIGPRNLLDQRPRQAFEQSGFDRAGKHRLELVAAQAADLAMVAHHQFQPVRDLAKERVTDRVAEGIVDVLEPVEVDQEQRAALAAVGGVAQRLVECLAHQRAIGQAGQGIEAGETADLLFGAALLGKVGADSAEAEETAAIVEQGVAGQGPVNVLVARGADDHVAEREAGGKMEAEGALLAQAVGRAAVDRQQVGELAAEKLFGLALEVIGQLLRHIGQRAQIVGFPEPAAAAVFEFVDKLERLASLGLEMEPDAGVGQHGPGAGDACKQC